MIAKDDKVTCGIKMKLFSRLSTFQEVFAVEDPMFVVQVTADVPVLYTGHVTLIMAFDHLSSDF